MKKIKIFNKFLLTSTILLASVSIAPLILTSCSKVTQEQDSTNNDPNNNQKPPSSDGNTQKPGDNDSTQKPSQPTIPKAINIPNLEKINPTKINDSFYFDIKGQISDPNQNQAIVNKIYDSIVVDKNKFINNDLVGRYNFQEQKQNKNSSSQIDFLKDKITLEKSDYSNKNDNESLKKILLDGGLKWFGSSKSINKSPSNNIELNLIALNIDDLINNADVNCEINFIDKPLNDSTITQNLLDENNKYEFKYTIKPKNNNYWSNVNQQYKQSPIIIKFEKNINEISLAENINEATIVTPHVNSPIINQDRYYIAGKKNEITSFSGNTELYERINNLLSLNLTSNQLNTNYWMSNVIVVPKSSYDKLIELFNDVDSNKILTANDGYIDLGNYFPWNDNSKYKKINFSLDNLKNQLKKRRIDVNIVMAYSDGYYGSYINFEFKPISNIRNDMYKWHNANNKNMPIMFRLEWSNKIVS